MTMSEKTNKQKEKKGIKRNAKGQFVKGIKPPGRPKGAKDKVSRTVKQNIEETFQKLGGIEGLVKWAKKSNRNAEKVYDWYFSMLPKNVDASVAGDLGLTIHRIIEDKEPAE
jgi:hypothetical protein